MCLLLWTSAKWYNFPSTLPITNKSKVFQADTIHNNVFQLLSLTLFASIMQQKPYLCSLRFLPVIASWMPCSVTVTMHFSSPSNNKPVSCFVTIHSTLQLFHSFRRLSQFSDTWEWNLLFAKSSKSCGKLESSCYWQVQEQLGQEHKHSSFTQVSEYSQGISNSQLNARWQTHTFLES